MIRGSRKDYLLSIDVTTSIFEQHNTFDYQATTQELSPTISSHHEIDLHSRYIHILRAKVGYEMKFQVWEGLTIGEYSAQEYEHLGAFEIRYVGKNIILRFYEIDDLINDPKLAMLNKAKIKNKQSHSMFIVVRSIKNQNQESIGCKLNQEAFLKIGQKQYFVSSVDTEKALEQEKNHKRFFISISQILSEPKKIKIQDKKQEGECKYCMMEQGQEDGQFLCSPCKCSGSCALVHFHCLEKWNQSKVKKNKIKGMTYYNFQKFFCEVCKDQYPKYIQKGKRVYELMPIDIPKGEHIILEEVQVKNSCLICIEDIPPEGIRMGRGNECEIRVDSPSISRNHACIVKKYGEYYVFDNKSKFGTLLKDKKMYLEMDFTKKGIQIDRSVLMFSLSKRNQGF